MSTTTSTTPVAGTEARALRASLDDLAPDAPTACGAWTVHDLCAHLAAGSKELADLIEEKLHGRTERPTRGFEEREMAFRSLDHDELMARLTAESRRKLDAYDALGAHPTDPTISFTGARLTADELAMHSRSEAAIHRWDVVGDDDISRRLLSQPELTAHGVKALNAMPVLVESARSLRTRLASTRPGPHSFALRAPGQPDVVLTTGDRASNARFELHPPAAVPAAAALTMRADSRLLVLWGRHPNGLDLLEEGHAADLESLKSALWAHAAPWP